MKSKILVFLFFTIATSVFAKCQFSSSEQNDPWTQQQLLDPALLANVLKNPNSPQPLVFSIGMQAIIKGSIDIGPTMIAENLNILKEKLNKLPKDAQIVVYCGCCPFSRCPNIRPAMVLLKSMQFTNFKLLNLPENVKVDWIDKDYPMAETSL
ncbi:MAG: rhodanese-like domain-containing protein [Mariniphaga sp.]|nr:rhodanese-like domain-containing protein [Mariniphaga sp.]